jgi:hypothetical protein
MSTNTQKPVLLIGGSGFVGARAARALRRLQPGLPIAIAARDQAKAAAVAAEVGGPTTAIPIDIDRRDLGLAAEAAFCAVVVLIKDHSLHSLKYAQAKALPYVSFSDFVFEIAPEIALYIRKPTSAAVLMLGHVLGGTATLAALHFAKEFRILDTIEIAGVIDADDLGGPASQADFERLANGAHTALILEDARWIWVGGQDATRRFIDVTGVERQGQPLPVLDVASLAAATDARSIRFDLATRDATSRRDGASTELIIEIAGERHDGTTARVRHEIVDDDIYARLSAHGAALATERLLGLAGGPPVAPGLYHPEVLLDPAHVIARLQELGARVRRA